MFKKTQKPTKRPDSSYLGLALSGNMITGDEHRAVLKGEAEIVRRNMIDENSHGLVLKTPVPAGHTIVPLYHNRCDDILIARLLGED